MTQDNDNNIEDEVPAAAGPGRRLRESRESHNLTQQQVASQLRMQVRIIEALESDDYSGLPGATFVQGYLRSYARLLGLPEENILGLMPSGKAGTEPELVGSILDGKEEVSSSDLPFRLVTMTVIIVAVIGLGWWFSQQEPSPELIASPPLADGGEHGLSLPDVDEPAVDVSLPDGVEADSQEELVDETIDTGSAEAMVDESTPPEPEPEPPVETAAVAPLEHSEPQIAPLLDTTPQSMLEMEYQADSWSEVYDSAGRKLSYGLVPAGSTLRLHGEAPFRVFLGYATGVTVYYNGSLYDHSPYQRGDVARFRIGRAEHNSPLSGN